VIISGGKAATVRRGGRPTVVAPFFEDSFAGGQRNNANGFVWSTSHANMSVSTENPRTGTHSLRFRFPPADPGKSDQNAQQSFALGRDLTELWVEYYLWVPNNFVLRGPPDWGNYNNKFIALWNNSYDGAGSITALAEFGRDNDDSSTSRMVSSSETDGSIRGKDAYHTPNFVSKAKAGKWTQVRVHYKMSSGLDQPGIWKCWMDGELVWRNRSDWAFFRTGGENYIRQGYLLGAANTGYTDETIFYMDDFRFYDQNPGWVDAGPWPWGKYVGGASQITSGNAHFRMMGGTSPNIDNMRLRTVRIEAKGVGTQPRVAVYTGGSLDNPIGATLLEDLGQMTLADGKQFHGKLSDHTPSIPKNTPVWVAFKHDTGAPTVYYNSSGEPYFDFQTERGRAQITGATGGTDQTAGFPTTLDGTAAFSSSWYSYYLTYTVGV
jgi:hypothetical protein